MEWSTKFMNYESTKFMKFSILKNVNSLQANLYM